MKGGLQVLKTLPDKSSFRLGKRPVVQPFVPIQFSYPPPHGLLRLSSVGGERDFGGRIGNWK
jgi:hypothetical protein